MVSEMLTIILLSCSLAITTLAVIILYANYRSASNRWLSVFALCGVLWLLANVGANVAPTATSNLLFSRSTLIGASLLPLTYVFFCASFTRLKQPIISRLYLCLPVILLLLTLPTKLYIASVSSGGSIQPGIAYDALLLVLVGYFSYGTILLVREYRRSERMRKRQLYYMLLGITLTIAPAMLLSAILPVLGYSQGVAIAPVFTLVFLLFTSVAILRHHLFDIRLFVVRAVAYGLTTLLVSLFYALPAVWLLTVLAHVHLTPLAIIGLTVVLLILAGVYRYIIRWFDRFTKRIFYRNYYDPQDVLDKLGNVLARTIDISRLQQESERIIVSALNVNFLAYWLEGDPQTTRVAALFGQSSTQNVILLDEIVDHQTAIDSLKREGIAAVVRLRVASTHGESGYIVLGPKRSGELYSKKDTRLLGTVADELAISFQNALHFAEIQNFNVTLQAKVENATKQLKQTNHRLRELDSTKDDFISMASHQLRTPLTSVKGYLSMVLEGDAGKLNDNQRKLLEQSYRSSQQMVYLISDLLNLSRLNTGKFIIENSVVSLNEVVQAEIEQLAETAKARGVTLIYDRPKSFPKLLLDETKTHQVIMNFIDNAIYYTPSGGTVTVALRETPTTVEYTVKDNGIGVPKSVQHKLFAKFYRAQNAQKARPDGTGLGLFMAKKVVVAQGGATIFESEEGKGSTFGFRFNKAGHVPPTD